MGNLSQVKTVAKAACNQRLSSDKKTPLSDLVYDYVVEKISKGHWQQGKRLTEEQIAQEAGTSKIPVREAVERLCEHNWVEKYPGKKGIFIKVFNEKEIQETYILREMIEAEAIRRVIGNISKEKLNELRKIVKLLKHSWDENDAEAFKKVDRQFHQCIVEATGNQKLTQMFENLIMHSQCQYFIGASGYTFYAKQAEESLKPVSHEKILKAIIAQDSEKAERLIRQHVIAACQMVIELKNFVKLL